MNNEIKHAPLPWHIEHDVFIVDADGNDVDDINACGLSSTSTNEDNAAFIVRACNAHYELIEQNKKLKEFARTLVKENCWEWGDGLDIQDKAEELGIIESFEITEEDIDNELFYGIGHYSPGDICFRFSTWVKDDETKEALS